MPPASQLSSPLLPYPLAVPLSLLPDTLHSRLLAATLNRVLALPLRDGQLDFLAHRSVAIEVQDAGIIWLLTLDERRLCARVSHDTDPDLVIRASAHDLLALAGRLVDPDTLVFQRRLVMQGDTELGLRIKNCLDSLDADALGNYGPLLSLPEKILPWYRRLSGRRAVN